MGYESNVIIARKYHKRQDNVLDIVAELALCGMCGEFLDLFDREWKTGYYDLVSGMTITQDRYDKPITYATFNKVYKWCLDNAHKENYRRLDILLGILNSVRENWYDYGEFVILHYGY